MDVYVAGGEGALGTRVRIALQEYGHSVVYTPRKSEDISDRNAIAAILGKVQPDAIVNCAGVRHRPGINDLSLFTGNSIGAQILADIAAMADIPMIHISTDCVFGEVNECADSYPDHLHTVDCPAYPDSLYGWSKVLGEPDTAIVLRTSFITPEHGLMRYVTDQIRGHRPVDGWLNAYWSGSTSWAVAYAIAHMLEFPDSLHEGVYNLATHMPVDKAAVCENILACAGFTPNVIADTRIFHPVDRATPVYRGLQNSGGMFGIPVLPSLPDAFDMEKDETERAALYGEFYNA